MRRSSSCRPALPGMPAGHLFLVAAASLCLWTFGCDSADLAVDAALPPDLAVPVAAAPDLAVPTCNDHLKNGAETDVDCGGGLCPACTIGLLCQVATDCASTVCRGGKCLPLSSCSDGRKDGSETDVDCGGDCLPCGAGRACGVTRDCWEGVCAQGLCAMPSCKDQLRDGDETGVDCGGPICPRCADGQGCQRGQDCLSLVCGGGACVPASCADQIRNGDETDIDCGGACPPCADGRRCANSVDCASKVCSAGLCAAATCHDGIRNEDETDVDCGGALCPSCTPGKGCLDNSDCTSGLCTANVCTAAPSCSALHAALPKLPNGVYTIDADGKGPKPAFVAWCNMASDGGGWTLALKVDGTQNTFLYSSLAWTDETTFGGADLTLAQAKLQSYLSVPYTQVRVVMRQGNVERALVLVPSKGAGGTSLRATMKGDNFQPTTNTRAGWLGLLGDGSLQTRCGQEGLNNKVANGNLRIGIFGNQEDDCNTCDSAIGIGNDNWSAGNVAIAQWDDSGAGGRSTTVFAFVYVR